MCIRDKLAAILVFFMQPGFALVEAGFIRTKNTANVLMKNLIDFMFGSIPVSYTHLIDTASFLYHFMAEPVTDALRLSSGTQYK